MEQDHQDELLFEFVQQRFEAWFSYFDRKSETSEKEKPECQKSQDESKKPEEGMKSDSTEFLA